MWNPTRRNRNIGTEKSGHSQNNQLVIPERWADFRIYYERLNDPVIFSITVNCHEIVMMVEPTKIGYIHAVTPQDVTKVLSLVEQEHLEQVELIIFRQPKKKEEILKPVWGRYAYFADLGKYMGPAIYLEATFVNNVIKWSNKLDPYEKKELRSLENDGHQIKNVKKGYEIFTTPDSVRNTQLYRTLPHEIGHAVDFLKNCQEPSINAANNAENEYIRNAYGSKPSLDKEEYAHRYAREFYSKWSTKGSLPFNRIYEEKELEIIGLNPDWFKSSKS